MFSNLRAGKNQLLITFLLSVIIKVCVGKVLLQSIIFHTKSSCCNTRLGYVLLQSLNFPICML